MKNALMTGGIIIAALIIPLISANAQMVGGYKSVAVDNEQVMAAAEFAVIKRQEEHSEQEGLKLDAVKKAEMQVVAGINYRLCLSVKLEDETQQVKVVVYQNLKREYSLTSWTVEDCAESESKMSNNNNALMVQNVKYQPISKMAISHCTGNQLSLKEVEGEGEMGGKYHGNYVFTNISPTACTLSGYPVLILLNKAGKTMRGVKVNYDSNKPETVMIEPQKTAWFSILYSTGKMGYDPPKNPPSSAKIKVTVPKINKTFVLKSEIAAYKQVWVSAIRIGLPD